MKRIHLLRTTRPADDVAGLITALAADGCRTGWLDLTGTLAGAPLGGAAGSGLDRIAGAGALRAVSLDEGRTVAVKRVDGPPVLRDILREHFLGCTVVLVRTAEDVPPSFVDSLAEVPGLEPAGECWRVTPPGRGGLDLASAALAARLRRPRPWE